MRTIYITIPIVFAMSLTSFMACRSNEEKSISADNAANLKDKLRDAEDSGVPELIDYGIQADQEEFERAFTIVEEFISKNFKPQSSDEVSQILLLVEKFSAHKDRLKNPTRYDDMVTSIKELLVDMKKKEIESRLLKREERLAELIRKYSTSSFHLISTGSNLKIKFNSARFWEPRPTEVEDRRFTTSSEFDFLPADLRIVWKTGAFRSTSYSAVIEYYLGRASTELFRSSHPSEDDAARELLRVGGELDEILVLSGQSPGVLQKVEDYLESVDRSQESMRRLLSGLFNSDTTSGVISSFENGVGDSIYICKYCNHEIHSEHYRPFSRQRECPSVDQTKFRQAEKKHGWLPGDGDCNYILKD